MRYTAHVTREGKWWMIRVPEIDGLTQARRLSEASVMAADYIALVTEAPADSVEVDLVVDSIGEVDVAHTLEGIRSTRSEAAQLEEKARRETALLARRLADERVPVRDIGSMLNVSFQRAHQLVHSARP
ncbi:hypothetical protein N1031_00325 [Herbiconiux moechotypicola]|uniref:HicB family toxin-antitoxin system n=1 Tax=Herbiconiux moechotypicola TaxID=637393 RepID=A0ABN3D8W1_9MICO|nr:hypothetical protein [Herbiconiux moechotypicola]MCS5728195.1 hypothetical protein [Herbiconiux moechotypicola]